MMQRRSGWFIVLSVLMLCVRSTVTEAKAPDLHVDAKAAVLMDADSGQIIFEQDPTTRLSPASLTKLMTVYLCYDAIRDGTVRLNEQVSVSRRASRMGGSQIFLEAGDRITFGDLLRGISIASGNDATIAVAEHIGGFPDAFVARMNSKADKLGLSDTRFENPHGLPATNQYTTAHDVAVLSLHLVWDYPAALQLHSMKEFEYNGIKQWNRNRLLWKDRRVNGLKTGWLQEAGYHIVATAREGDRRLIAVVMGAESERAREEISLRLLNYGFKNFHNVEFFSRGNKVKNLPVWKGTQDYLGIAATGPGIVTLANGSPQPTLAYQFPNTLVAPISARQKVGEAVFTVDGREVTRVDLVAMHMVPEAGFFKRLLHSFLLLFN